MDKDGKYDKFYHEALEYFTEKFPNEPGYMLMEAAAFMANRMMIVVDDAVAENIKYTMRLIESKKYYHPPRRINNTSDKE